MRFSADKVERYQYVAKHKAFKIVATLLLIVTCSV